MPEQKVAAEEDILSGFEKDLGVEGIGFKDGKPVVAKGLDRFGKAAEGEPEPKKKDESEPKKEAAPKKEESKSKEEPKAGEEEEPAFDLDTLPGVEKKEEPKAKEELEPEVVPDKPTKEAFASMRVKLREKDQAVEQLNSRIKELEAGTQDADSKATIESLRTQLTEAQDTISRLSLEHDPRFKQKFVAPAMRIHNQAKAILKEAGIDEAIADQAVALPITKRIRFLAENAASVKEALIPLFLEVDRLRSDRAAELQNHKQLAKQLADEEEKLTREAKTDIAETVLRKFKDGSHLLLRTIPGNDVFNKNVAGMERLMRNVVNVDDPEKQVELMMHGLEAPILQRLLISSQKKIAELSGELRKRKGLSADIGSGDGGGKGVSDRFDASGKLKPIDSEAAAAAAIAKAQAG